MIVIFWQATVMFITRSLFVWLADEGPHSLLKHLITIVKYISASTACGDNMDLERS